MREKKAVKSSKSNKGREAKIDYVRRNVAMDEDEEDIRDIPDCYEWCDNASFPWCMETCTRFDSE